MIFLKAFKSAFVVAIALILLSNGNHKVVNRQDCRSLLKDSTLINGAFVNYQIADGLVTVQWGNKTFSRQLKEEFYCDGPPNAIPWIDRFSDKYIVMRRGCGSPCWYFYVLPLAKEQSITNGMFDLDMDLEKEQIVYIDNHTLTIEQLGTHRKQTVIPKIDCKAVFLGFCVDSIQLANNKLYIEWVDWKNNEKNKVVQQVDVKL